MLRFPVFRVQDQKARQYPFTALLGGWFMRWPNEHRHSGNHAQAMQSDETDVS